MSDEAKKFANQARSHIERKTRQATRRARKQKALQRKNSNRKR